MKMLIDIPDEIYKNITWQPVVWNGDTIRDAIKNGIPLPKGHGRLIDADALKSECYSIVDPKGIYSELKIIEDYYIDDASTIIEADVPKRRKGIPLEENDSGYNCENWIP